MRPLIATAWILFSVTAYLMLVGALRPWVRLPNLGNVGFTLVFVLFALVHSCAMDGPRQTAVFFVISALISYVMEEMGVRTGRLFGHYHYSDMLGPKLGHVPVIIPLAWFMMIYSSWTVARALVQGINTASFSGVTAQAAIAALVMTSWDLVMDPGMAAAGNWVWERGGAYFGVPSRNYAGWLLTTFLIYGIVGCLRRRASKSVPVLRVFAAPPVLTYCLYAFFYLTANPRPALRVIALFSMGTPGLLALIRLFMSKEPATYCYVSS